MHVKKPAKKKQTSRREKAKTIVEPIPVPQISGHKAKPTRAAEDADEERVDDPVQDTQLKSWIEGNIKVQERWIDPKTKKYVKDGTPGAEKLRTEQLVTDRACADYRKRTDTWRDQLNSGRGFY